MRRQPDRRIATEHFDEFFAPLVGSPTEVSALRGRLADTLTDSSYGSDMYARLATGVHHAMESAAGARMYSDDPDISGAWQRIARNSVVGTLLTVQGLRTLGNICHQYASVPQHPKTVGRNTNIMIGHIYGYAQTGGLAGSINAEALHLGLNPRKVTDVVRLFWHVSKHGISAEGDPYAVLSHKSFSVNQNTQGQITVQPRYRRRGKSGVMPCPAVEAKKVPGEKRLKPAMFTLLQTIGDVAVSEIYPQHFDIAVATAD